MTFVNTDKEIFTQQQDLAGQSNNYTKCQYATNTEAQCNVMSISNCFLYLFSMHI